MKPKPAQPTDEYEVEHALHVLTEAEKHRQNPKMMERVSRLAAEKKQHLAKVARMKPTKSTPAPRKR